MATQILRPTNITGEVFSGFGEINGETAIEAINDDNTQTKITQSNVESEIKMDFQDGASSNFSVNGVTINGVVITVVANAGGRAGASTLSVKLFQNTAGQSNPSGAVQTTSLTYDTSTSSGNTNAYEGTMTAATVDGFEVLIEPNAQGCVIREVFLTVTYTLASEGYGNEVNGVAANKIVSINLVAAADISTINLI